VGGRKSVVGQGLAAVEKFHLPETRRNGRSLLKGAFSRFLGVDGAEHLFHFVSLVVGDVLEDVPFEVHHTTLSTDAGEEVTQSTHQTERLVGGDPLRPRSLRCRRKAVQLASSS